MNASSLLESPGLVARAALTSRQRAEMFALLQSHFNGVTRSQFERDLAEKNWVIELRRDERLVGFTTLRVTTSSFEGSPILVIYSGDTIVAPEAWGTPALARAWIAGVNHLRGEFPERRCFWLLLTSGFRTYRFLPVFWRNFFPHYAQPTPAPMQALLTQLARAGYRGQFDPATGLVRFAAPQQLRGSLAAVPPGREIDPHVAYFLKRNPGHGEGDELVCLAEISAENLTAAGRRMTAPIL